MSALKATLACDGPVFAAIQAIQAERDQLRAEVERLKTCGIVELAAINSSVLEYCKHWEARAERAEAELAAEREKVRVLHKALKNIKNSICRIVPDGYSQPCVDESADECDRIIDAALKEDVGIGMVAGWPTPEQYEDAAKRVIEIAAHIRAQTKKGGRK